MLSSNSENKTAPSLLSDNHEEDEISSINENQDTLFSYFTKISQFEYRTPPSIDDFLNILEIAFNDCFKVNQQKPMVEHKKRDKIFEVVRPIKALLFTKLEDDLFKEEENTFMNRKRYKIRRSRRENQDNIRKKIKRGFLNNALIPKINMIIKKQGGKFVFEIFKQHFVSDVTRKNNMELFNMTLEEIFRKKELYNEIELNSYYYNLKLINNKEIQENKELKNILNLKLLNIFEEYINSKELNIDETKRLKSKNMKDSYIKRYIHLAKNFIKFITE
jgi:hypothetical protein